MNRVMKQRRMQARSAMPLSFAPIRKCEWLGMCWKKGSRCLFGPLRLRDTCGLSLSPIRSLSIRSFGVSSKYFTAATWSFYDTTLARLQSWWHIHRLMNWEREAAQLLAYYYVQLRACAMAPFSSLFQWSATASSSGSSQFGADIKAWTERSTALIWSAGDHLVLRMSRQMRPIFNKVKVWGQSLVIAKICLIVCVLTKSVDVGVVDLGAEEDFGGDHGVLLGEEKLKREQAAFIRWVLGTRHLDEEVSVVGFWGFSVDSHD